MEDREPQRKWHMAVPTVVLALALAVGAAGGFWLKGIVGTPGVPASSQRPPKTGSGASTPTPPPGEGPGPATNPAAGAPPGPATPALPATWEVSFAPFAGFDRGGGAGGPGPGGALRMEAQAPTPGPITALGASRGPGPATLFGAMGSRVFRLDLGSGTLSLYTCPVPAATLISWLGEAPTPEGHPRLLGLAERLEVWLWPPAGRSPRLLGLYPFPGWVMQLAGDAAGEVRGYDVERRFFRLRAPAEGQARVAVAERWEPDEAVRKALLDMAQEAPPSGLEDAVLDRVPGARGVEALAAAGPAGPPGAYLALVQTLRAFELDPASDSGSDLGPAPHRAQAQCADHHGRLYVLGGGHLYRFEPASCEFRDLGQPPRGPAYFGPLVPGPGDQLCVPFWFSFDTSLGAFERLDGASAPRGAVLAVTQGPDGALYGGTDQGGSLFRWRPGGRVEWLGRPIPELGAESGEEVAPVSALAAGPDGLVYGVVGKGAAWRSFDALFRLDPATGKVVDWFRVYPGLETLAAAPDGYVYGAADGRMVRLGPLLKP